MSEVLARAVIEAAHIELPHDWSLARFGEELEFIQASYQIQNNHALTPIGKDALPYVRGLRHHIQGIKAALCSFGDGIPETETERASLGLHNHIIARVNLTNDRGSEWFVQLMKSLALLDTVLAGMEPTEHALEQERIFGEHGRTIEQWRRWVKSARDNQEISAAEADKLLAKEWLQVRRAPKSDAHKVAFRDMIRSLRVLWAKAFGSEPRVSPPSNLRVGSTDRVTPGQRFPLLVVAMADHAGCDPAVIPMSPEALRQEITRALEPTEADSGEVDLDK